METQLASAAVLLSPLSFLAAAIISRYQPGLRPQTVIRSIRGASYLGLAVAAVCAVATLRFGLLQTPTLGWQGLGLSLRLDPLSSTMLLMIALLAVVIVRFSCNYLDGDQRHGAFLGRLAATIASVQMLVLAGNLGLLALAWIATSLSLHTLLVFYPERPRAQLAARKKFLVARLGDAALLMACGLLYVKFGTGNLEAIFVAMRESDFGGTAFELATVLIAFAAILKSAQFPTHGWLVEVMETPTPVSALLHAGILNAGPYLVTRMAIVMSESATAPVLLVACGGFTALFASIVLLTQPSVKVALGYSSAAHMGFMLMVCGLGVYPAAVLHLVAHSFYKAHAFLSSGSVVEAARAQKILLPQRLASPLRIASSIVAAIACYGLFAWAWGIDPLRQPALLAVGAILVMGLAQIIAPAWDSRGPIVGVAQACLLASCVTLAFFSLETGAHLLLHDVLPEIGRPSGLTLSLTGFVLLAFAVTVLLQIVGLERLQSTWARHLVVHLRNGLYANAIFDRLVGGLRHRPSSAAARADAV
ncbi:MAG: hypothetical protein KDA38_06845 [Planctomycetales bacterium]|nr:hypothetical protein [Planctomycetales bacterium]